MSNENQLCEVCDGLGILYTSYEGAPAEYDVDHIVRCDTCAQFAGDLEAARALAASVPLGSWLVYVVDLAGGLPATEDSNIFLRHSLGSVACLQLSLLKSAPDDGPECPRWVVRVEWVDEA